MAKYIDADALMEEIRKAFYIKASGEILVNIDDALNVIGNMPAADVEPVRHGKWTVQECYSDIYIICPVCGFSIKIGAPHRFKWCPGCGVKMDGGSEDDHGGA